MRPGSNLGPYRLLEQLGRGGMAAVYRAYEPSLDRYVALKLLPADALADPDFTARFRREAKVIAGLEHRHIVPIYAYGIDDGVPWMAMRLVAGGTLAAVLERGPLSLERAAGVLGEVAAALDFAHQRGVLHRDVKPQNILLDEQGHSYLADFGVARMMERTPVVTRSGVVTGTPLYMSPEQARGEHVDHRTDIYALGIVAYEMLTGRVPFTADTPVAVLMKHIMDSIPLPPAGLVPEPVLRVLLKALAKEPESRWGSGRHFVEAFRGAVRAERGILHEPGTSIETRPTQSQWPRAVSHSVPGWRRSGVLALSTATIATVAVVAGLILGRPRAALEPGAPPASGVTPSTAPALPGPAVFPLSTPQAAPAARAAPSPSEPRARAAPVQQSAAPPPRVEPLPTEAPKPSETGASLQLAGAAATLVPAPALAAEAPGAAADVELPDGLSFMVGRWEGSIQQRKSPFISREIDRTFRTECKRFEQPSRVFCRSDWGILEDWLVVRYEERTNRYLYQDSEGIQGVAGAGGGDTTYEGSRLFEGHTISWRLTQRARGADAFSLTMEWSRDRSSWHTIYVASLHRSP